MMPLRRAEAAGVVLALPLEYRAPANTVPHRRLSERKARRRLQLSEQLSGDLINLGYYFAELHVGTPPQRFSLIVDTGSSVTAIPCAGCGRCGRHSNPRFDPQRSATFRRVSCEEGVHCRSCREQQCGYRVSYQEGSSYAGFLAQDVIHFGRWGSSASGCSALRFAFGCSTEETGLFRSQQADGIMGLASSRRPDSEPQNPTVLEALVEQGVVSNVFSLCIANRLGRLTFGMPGDSPDSPPRMWTSVQDTNFYSIAVLAVRLGRRSLARHQPPTSSIVDSGTTFMYMHTSAFVPLLRVIRSKRCKWISAVPSAKDEFCVRLASPSPTILDKCYDNVTVHISGGSLSMPPSQYFYASEPASEYCLGIFNNYEQTLVLGAINMMNHEITFDRDNKRIGFRRHACAAPPPGPTVVNGSKASMSMLSSELPKATQGTVCELRPVPRWRREFSELLRGLRLAWWQQRRVWRLLVAYTLLGVLLGLGGVEVCRLAMRRARVSSGVKLKPVVRREDCRQGLLVSAGASLNGTTVDAEELDEGYMNSDRVSTERVSRHSGTLR